MRSLFHFFLFSFLMCCTVVVVAQPANDDCSTATSLGTLNTPSTCFLGTGGTGTTTTLNNQTNVNATPETIYPYIAGCPPSVASLPADVWYTFVASGSVGIINVSGATFANPVIVLWDGSGSCANLGGLGCITGTGNAATLTVSNLLVGNTYYIQISGQDATQTGTFKLKVHNNDDCSGCLLAASATASPLPVNGTYTPGQTVTFCYTVTDWQQTNTNWFHGVQVTYGSGWNAASLVAGPPPASCDGIGTWAYYPAGITSYTNGTLWGPGYYYNGSRIAGNPPGAGGSYGDDCTTNSWQFCVTITTSSACVPGSDLSFTFNTSGDGESGGWQDLGCQNDPGETLFALGSCCPPTMTTTAATCAAPTSGTATATPVGTNGPWTYQWSSGATPLQTNVNGASTETGLSGGTVTVTVTDASNCTSTASITVAGGGSTNAGPDRNLTCITLPGGSVTMGASGSGTWSQSGNPGTATITTPGSATTTITGFTAPGTYNFTWTVAGCPDVASVIVTAKPNASFDQTICPYTVPSMNGSGGAGTWSALSTNPTPTPVITNPALANTTISGFVTPGIYHFVWTVGTCTDTMAVTVTPKPNAGTDVNVCLNTTATMGATGSGTWSIMTTLNPATTVVTTPSSATTTITGFSVVGPYYYIWTVNGCTDTVTVNAGASPNAGSNQVVSCAALPGGTATMNATGAGTWSQSGNPGGATINSPNSPVTTISGFTVAGVYTFTWTTGGCAGTATVTVSAGPNAGPDQAVSCAILPGGTATMNATALAGSAWTQVTPNPGTATITSTSAANTTITNFSAAGTYGFIWSNGGCKDTAYVVVTAKPSAGADQTICEYTTATMAAGGGAGTWSQPAGNPATAAITSLTLANTTVTGFTAPGAYYFIWTVGSCPDTVIINVTAKPAAGPDQTICQYSTATMAAVGAGTWTIPTGNPAVTAIANAALGTTTITGYTAAGQYYYIWTVNGCADTVIVTVTAKPSAGPDQTICEYTTATMAGVGSGLWSEPTGNPATATITTPSLAGTTVTGFTAPGAYYFVWTVNGCADTMIVNVTAKPVAGPDQTICQYSTATMAGVGAGTWTIPTGNPAVTTITTPSSGTTTIKGYTVAGQYYYIWTVSGCADTTIITVTAKPDAGPDQTICEYTSATMAGVGLGVWSQPPGNPATTVITTPASGFTTITGFTAAGIYYYIWTANGCADTMTVTVTAKPAAGPDQTICEYTTATMAGVGSGTWSTPPTGNPAVTTITTPTSATTTITGYTAPGAYKYIWTVNGCTDTMIVNVTAKPAAGADQSICAFNSVTMAGVGSGVWSQPTGNPVTATITTPTSGGTTVSGFTTAGVYYFIWTVNGCADTMTVTVSGKPVAGPDQTICEYTTATMAGVGSGIWSTPVTGNPAVTTITTPSSGTTTVTGFTAAGVYLYIWTVNGCADSMTITITAKPDAGADQSICALNSVTLAGVGSGAWSQPLGNPVTATIATPSSGSTTVSGFTAAGVYYFIWTVNGCTDTMTVTVTAKPVAGPDQTICEYTAATLAGVGAGTWTQATGDPATAAFTNTSLGNTTVTGFTAAGVYNFIWTVNGCADSVTITVTAKPDAGADQNICAFNSVTLAGVGTGVWSQPTGNPVTATIATPSSGGTTVSGFTTAGVYYFIWTVNGCADTMTVTVTAKPVAGPDQTICQYTTATLAGAGAGTWTEATGDPATAVFTNASLGNTTVTGFTAAGVYNFIWTINGCADSMTVTVTAKPDAGVDQTICEYTTATMAGVGSGTWSIPTGNPAVTTITSPSLGTTTITGYTAAGLYYYIWTVNGCADTMTVTVTAKPVAGPDQTICQYTTATLAGAGAGTWTEATGDPATAVFTNASLGNTTVTGFTAAGVYNFIWTINGCADSMTVTVTAKPDAGADQSICLNTSTVMAAAGAGNWTIPAGNPAVTVIATPSSPTTGITGFTAIGNYVYIWTVNGCADTVQIAVNPLPSAGPDQTICEYTTATMAGVGVGTWSDLITNPLTTTIANPNSASTTISGFNAAGVYRFYFMTGSCSDTMSVTVIAKPDAGPDQTICQYTDATMAGVGAGTWTIPTGNPAVTVIANASQGNTTITGYTVAGSYKYIWTVNGCADTVIVKVTAKPDAGLDQTICQYTDATMAGVGPGNWSTPSGNPFATTINAPSTPNTTITGFDAAGPYVFIWTVAGCPDTTVVNVTAKPDAGADQTICQYTTATTAATGTGAWTPIPTNPAMTVIVTPNNAITDITGFDLAGDYGFVWTVNGCTDTTIVTVTAKPDAGQDQTICINTSATMAGVGSGTWTDLNTNPTATTIVSPNNSNTVITGFGVSGGYIFVWMVNGCTDTMIVNVTAQPDAGPDQNICQNATATMAAVGTGTWTDIPSNPNVATIANPGSATTNITGLSNIGVYSFIWTSNGCNDTVDIYTNQVPTVTIANDTICTGGTASVTAVPNPIGGSFLWNTTDVTDAIIVNPTTTTSYNVTYTLGVCSAQATGTVVVNTLPVVSVTTVNAICTTNNGVAIAEVTGNAPYTYSWAGGAGSTDTIRGLTANTYTVSVTDVNSCTATASGTVGLSTATIPITLAGIHDLKCNNDSTGSININAVDSGVLTYGWSDGNITGNISNLPAGSYQVTVTDQFGCTGTAQYSVSQPTPLVLTPPAHVNPTCPGASDGTATDTASGGSGAYHYAWNSSPPQNTQQATGLPSATYTVVVTDDSACVATASVTLTDPAAITFAAPVVTDALCKGSSDGTGQVLAQSGIGPYGYIWSDPASQTTSQAIGLKAGTYTVTATDSKGCTASATATVGEPSLVTVAATPTDLTCFQNNSGMASALADGGTPPYKYLWNNNDSVAQITDLSAASYTVTASDAHGCTATATTTLNQPASIAVTLSAVITTCASSTDGSITISGVGGSGTLTYSLRDITGNAIQTNTTGTFTGLGPNLFTAVATDQNGCSAGDTITVPRAPFNVYTATADSTSCYGDQYKDGAIHLQGYTIPNGPYQYSLDGSPLQSTADFYAVSAGVHTIHAVDAHGCDTTFTLTVGEPLPASVDILPGDSTIALGSTLQLSTAFQPYSTDSIKSYAWSPGEGLSCIDCPAPVVSPFGTTNVYTVTVTYNQGCIAITTVHVNVDGDPPVYVPNAFTPNGDGNNDVLYVYGEGIKTIKLSIFNRWGEKVYESDNQSEGWDGTYRGVAQPPGVFVYTVDLIYLNNRTRLKEGSITLIR